MEMMMKTQIQASVPSLPLELLMLSTKSLRTKRTIELSVPLIKLGVPARSPLKSISKKGNNIPNEAREKMIERTMNKI
jgi:hypothetical protein